MSMITNMNHNRLNGISSGVSKNTQIMKGPYNNVDKAVVTIMRRDLFTQMTYTASGFIYKQNNEYYVVTAAHIVDFSQGRPETVPVTSEFVASVIVKPVTGTTMSVVKCQLTLMGVAGLADVAVFAIDLPLGKIPANDLSFAKSVPGNGSKCWVVGDPLGLDAISISHGVIRDNSYIYNRGTSSPTRMYIESVCVDAPVLTGNSGGAILDSDSNVIGIVSFGIGAHGAGIGHTHAICGKQFDPGVDQRGVWEQLDSFPSLVDATVFNSIPTVLTELSSTSVNCFDGFIGIIH